MRHRGSPGVIGAVAAAATVAVLGPVAVHASSSFVVVKDPVTEGKVRVDGGRLRVGDGGGVLTVEERVQAFQRRVAITIPVGDTIGEASFTAPAEGLALTHASHQSAFGRGPAEISISVGSAPAFRNFLDVRANEGENVVSQPLGLTALPGQRIEVRFRIASPSDRTQVYYLYLSGRRLA